MSKTRSFVESVRDNSMSFIIGAVPAFLGTAMLAGTFSLGYGIGAAIGLPGALSFVGGLVVAGVTFSGAALVGLGLGAGGLLGAAALIDKVPFLKKADIAGPGLTAGIFSGIAASVALAFNLTAGSPPPEHGALIEKAPVVASYEQGDHGTLGVKFTNAGNDNVKVIVDAPSSQQAAAPRMAL